jgi:hypothetical protein
LRGLKISASSCSVVAIRVLMLKLTYYNPVSKTQKYRA